MEYLVRFVFVQSVVSRDPLPSVSLRISCACFVLTREAQQRRRRLRIAVFCELGFGQCSQRSVRHANQKRGDFLVDERALWSSIHSRCVSCTFTCFSLALGYYLLMLWVLLYSILIGNRFAKVLGRDASLPRVRFFWCPCLRKLVSITK